MHDKLIGIFIVAFACLQAAATAASDDDNVTTLTESGFLTAVVMQFHHVTEPWIDRFFKTEEQKSALKSTIKRKEEPALFTLVVGNGYFRQTNVKFVQELSVYEIGYKDVLAISDNFSGKMVEGTMAMGIIFIPERMSLSDKIEVVYDDARTVLRYMNDILGNR